jgi:acyl dehydratase
MNDVAPAANPRGRFDRSTIGRSVTATVQVERGRIRFFSQVLGETQSIHTSVDLARASSYSDLVAPPSFFMAIEADANAALVERGEATIAELIHADFRYLLHGDERYAYRSLIFAGDEIVYESRVLDFYDKKGGAMEFVTILSTLGHAERGLLVEARRTLLHRLPEQDIQR